MKKAIIMSIVLVLILSVGMFAAERGNFVRNQTQTECRMENEFAPKLNCEDCEEEPQKMQVRMRAMQQVNLEELFEERQEIRQQRQLQRRGQ